MSAFYVTTPIYYVNDAPHIGHAYTTVAADVLARWHRQRQEQTWFLTGTDEHGQKVMRSAEEHQLSPRAWADQLVESAWKPMLDVIDCSNDDFIRTTELRHTERVQEFCQWLYEAGEIYQGSYEGPYCVSCEEFKLPSELLENTDSPGGPGLCPIHRRPVEMLSETNYFFRLSKYTDRLLEHFRQHPEFVQPESARNEMISFLEQGLQDLSITRSTFDWGIPAPWDEAHVLYVWIDALLNYVTAAGYRNDPLLFEKLWPADVHFVGKDILRFHSVIWPAMLMAADLPLPRTVFAHGWLLVGGEKMSKTKLTGISPNDIVDTFGSDAFRYYFLRAIQFGSDGSFSWEHLTSVYTAELANGLGNLASRVAAMVGKYFDGVLPAETARGADEDAVAAALADTVRSADAAMTEMRFSDAVSAVNEFVTHVNGYVTEQQPWKVAKDESEQARARLATILYTAAEALRGVAVLHHPTMPRTAAALWELLGASESLGALSDQPVQQAGAWGLLPAGATVTKGAALFPRIEQE